MRNQIQISQIWVCLIVNHLYYCHKQICVNPTSSEDTGVSREASSLSGVARPPDQGVVFNTCVWNQMIMLMLGTRDGDKNRGRGGYKEHGAESQARPQIKHDVDVWITCMRGSSQNYAPAASGVWGWCCVDPRPGGHRKLGCPSGPWPSLKVSAQEGSERKTSPSTHLSPVARRRIKQTPPRVNQSLFEQVPFSEWNCVCYF